MVEVHCKTCGKSVLKPLKEYRRRIKNGHAEFYCGNRCSVKDNPILMANAQKSKENPRQTYEKLQRAKKIKG
ncbi:MAG: hypothetical protein NTZ48_06605, partial [Candidatus Omnitrophica bacterium]|nr:hypothetical protein [Candidatus Omnitrophota bacterium]